MLFTRGFPINPAGLTSDTRVINTPSNIYYVCTVNGPTSITRLGSFENVAKNCQFQFLDPLPTPKKKYVFFWGGV